MSVFTAAETDRFNARFSEVGVARDVIADAVLVNPNTAATEFWPIYSRRSSYLPIQEFLQFFVAENIRWCASWLFSRVRLPDPSGLEQAYKEFKKLEVLIVPKLGAEEVGPVFAAWKSVETRNAGLKALYSRVFDASEQPR